jgi:hypothetical protein
MQASEIYYWPPNNLIEIRLMVRAYDRIELRRSETTDIEEGTTGEVLSVSRAGADNRRIMRVIWDDGRQSTLVAGCDRVSRAPRVQV